MAQDIFAIITKVDSFEKLETLERNIRNRNADTPEVQAALNTRYAEFGRDIVSAKTGLDLSDLSPAEQRIVDATGRYVGLQKRDGKGAARTFQLLANRGLIEAAEATVAKSKVTQGFTVLDEADLRALSFEQIIVDYPEEFSARALWYARRTLGLPNESEKPPADVGTMTQQRTEKVFDWLLQRCRESDGALRGYANADIGAMLGFDDLTRYGRVLGNIQSRIDYACYEQGVPPLGLCVLEHFANAWAQEGRGWRFPVSQMRDSAQSFVWSEEVLEKVRGGARLLPGQAAIPWRKELREREQRVRQWAEGLRSTKPHKEVLEQSADAMELSAQEAELLGKTPEVRERISKSIERGSIGQRLKRLTGYRCQICEAIGKGPGSFLKPSGERYVEAHHATPVSEKEIGSLAATNIMILCANHHRQMHYGDVTLERTATTFELLIDGNAVSIARFALTGT